MTSTGREGGRKGATKGKKEGRREGVREGRREGGSGVRGEGTSIGSRYSVCT